MRTALRTFRSKAKEMTKSVTTRENGDNQKDKYSSASSTLKFKNAQSFNL